MKPLDDITKKLIIVSITFGYKECERGVSLKTALAQMEQLITPYENKEE